jgi:hypothetical protein
MASSTAKGRGQAPSTCRWQELKDFIREYAPHIRQAEIYEDENGNPTGHGSVIITRLDEAQRAYSTPCPFAAGGPKIADILSQVLCHGKAGMAIALQSY